MRFKLNSLIVSSLFVIFYILFNPLQTHASSSWYKYFNNPVLTKGNLGQWDEKYVYSGDVIKDGNIYKMWYTGADRFGKEQIGYATSLNGIVWEKYANNPVLGSGTSNEWDGFLASQATVLFDGNQYLMWYSGNNGIVSNENWKIGFATSLDGIHWQKFINNPVLIPSISGWDNKAVYQPVVIKTGINNFHLWYSATSTTASGPRWKIGYATSGDGINWTKYAGNPVLIVNQSWERIGGDGLGSPSVIYDGTRFLMWYHASGVGYAESLDGISWTKDPNNPVVPRDPFPAWDYFFLTDPNVIKDGSEFNLWYSGWKNYGDVSIGFASTSPSINYTPTPTITPSPTLPPKKPIIIVPGFGASINLDDFVLCNVSKSHDWKPIQKYKELYYDPLINTLKSAGLQENNDFYFYTYDWRQKPEDLAENFKKYLDNISLNHPLGTKFYMVGHSLGGLLLRSYVQIYADNKAYKILTAGTPHIGTLMSYPAWENGELAMIDDKFIKLFLNYLIVRCQLNPLNLQSGPDFNEIVLDNLILIKSRRQVVQSIAPILKSLLPVFDYLKKSGTVVNYVNMNQKNDFLISHPLPTPYNLPLTDTISGNNQSTLRFFNITDPAKGDVKKGDWVDGKIIGKENSSLGDNTILTSSSKINGLNTFEFDGDHQDVISASPAINFILNFLGLPLTLNINNSNVLKVNDENLIAVATDGIFNMKIIDSENNEINGDNNFIFMLRPKSGNYKLVINSNSDIETKIYVMLVKKNDEVKNKVYKAKIRKNKANNYYLYYSNTEAEEIRLTQE